MDPSLLGGDDAAAAIRDNRDRKSANRLSTISNYSVASNASTSGAVAAATGAHHRFERLVVVRAPPSQLRHPLNLQVQLINPSASTAQGHAQYGSAASSFNGTSAGGHLSRSTTASSHDGASSMHAVAEASVSGLAHSQPGAAPSLVRQDSDTPLSPVPGGGADLARSQSTRSVGSTTSSIGSSSTFASTMTGGAGTSRRILPCYNLEFHALQDSVVTDAGTDAKVAKIHRKGVELLGLAMLDPVYLEQAEAVPTLQARESARRALASEAASSSRQLTASTSSASVGNSDLKPSNLLSKFKRLSFRAAPPSQVQGTGEQRTSREGKRVSAFFFGGAAGGSNALGPSALAAGTGGRRQSNGSDAKLATSSIDSSTSGTGAPTAALAAYQIPSLPLLRERPSDDPHSISAGVEKVAKNLPDGLNPSIRKHAKGYAWVVRYYLRRDCLAEAGAPGKGTAGTREDIAEISVEWRKKRRRTTAGHNKELSSATAMGQRPSSPTPAAGPGVIIQERPATRVARGEMGLPALGSHSHSRPASALGHASIPSTSRRSSVQFADEQSDPPFPAMTGDEKASSRILLSPVAAPRLDTGVPKTHVQKPSDASAAASPTRGTKSFDLPRGSSLPLPGEMPSASGSGPSTMTESSRTDSPAPPTTAGATSPASALLGYGVQLGRAASLLAPNFLSRHRTAPSSAASPTDTVTQLPPAEAEAKAEASAVLSDREAALKALEGGSSEQRRSQSLAPSASDVYVAESRSSLETSDAQAEPPQTKREKSDSGFVRGSPEKEKQRRMSRDSTMASPAASRIRRRQPTEEDDGEESDPEDSERPWICELIVKRVAPEADSTPAKKQRILLGTLTPAPHHPKLVAQLAVPLTLASVPLTSAYPPSRVGRSSSDLSLGEREGSPELSVEDLKDLFTVTGLWLVVRENLGLGGIHKARKNDGAWRFATPAALKAG